MKKFTTSLVTTLIVLSFIACWPFFMRGNFDTHDGSWWIIRFSAFHQALTNGQFPVRFVERLNSNYGYPVFNYTYPLPYYLAELPKSVGFDFAQSIKMVFVVSTILSSVLMYWALTAKFSQTASFTSAIIYLYAPYRFVDLYVRGSIGESLVFAFVPLSLGALFRMSANMSKYFIILALSQTAIILSHNILAVFFIPLILLTSFLIHNRQVFLKSVVSLIIAVLLAAFFWIPALLDLKYVRMSNIDINAVDHLVSLNRIFYSRWGYGALPNVEGGFTAQVGIASAIILILSIFYLIRNKNGQPFITCATIIFIIAIFLISSLSMPLWQDAYLIKIIQHPWRLLSITTFLASILSANLIDSFRLKTKFVFIIAILVIIANLAYTKPISFNSLPDTFYSTNESTTAIWNEFMPIWVNTQPAGRSTSKFREDPNIEYLEKEENYLLYSAKVKAENDAVISINTIYFPGFKAYINGRETSVKPLADSGLLSFPLPKGEHKVIIKYGKSPVHLFSELVSLVTFAGTGIYFLYIWRKQNSYR